MPPDAPQVFQVSAQCVKLWKEGWFQQQGEPGGTSTLRNPKASWLLFPVWSVKSYRQAEGPHCGLWRRCALKQAGTRGQATAGAAGHPDRGPAGGAARANVLPSLAGIAAHANRPALAAVSSLRTRGTRRP